MSEEQQIKAEEATTEANPFEGLDPQSMESIGAIMVLRDTQTQFATKLAKMKSNHLNSKVIADVFQALMMEEIGDSTDIKNLEGKALYNLGKNIMKAKSILRQDLINKLSSGKMDEQFTKEQIEQTLRTL